MSYNMYLNICLEAGEGTRWRKLIFIEGLAIGKVSFVYRESSEEGKGPCEMGSEAQSLN
uniref:Uncharacterized protein n=1 Tax=Rhizophora mucronata TaxID=61149 RepID=A0A2P2JNZ4_RHIMU